jgi:pimeloyl-ACP methyl ester carboxylesterase
MSTFLLVHGAWQGASTWDLIVPKLQSAGHTVITPVLTGLGEDSNRLSVAVNLESHIEDVTGILKGENLNSVTLVGHSLRRRFRPRRRRIGARSASRSNSEVISRAG